MCRSVTITLSLSSTNLGLPLSTLGESGFPASVNEIPTGSEKLRLSTTRVEGHSAQGPVGRGDDFEEFALLIFSKPTAPRVLFTEESDCRYGVAPLVAMADGTVEEMPKQCQVTIYRRFGSGLGQIQLETLDDFGSHSQSVLPPNTFFSRLSQWISVCQLFL